MLQRKLLLLLVIAALASSSFASEKVINQEENLPMKWWQNTIVYQVYPKTFRDASGNKGLRAITNTLDYLKDLGVGAIWITPFYPSPMVDNGYDISDYTGIDEQYGSMKDFEELISEANKRGIKIVMDLVFNHSSDQHKWFLESKQSRDNPKADWYIWRDKPTNWRSIFGGSVWTWNEDRQQYYLHTFAKEQPDLNWENPEVRQALYDAANYWLDKGVGGFRIDAITYIKKPAEFLYGTPDGQDGLINVHTMTANTPGILDFLHEFKRKVFDGHDIFTVGEANGVKAEELPQWVGRNGVFDMLFEFSHTTLAYSESEFWCYPREWKLTELKGALRNSQEATKINGWYPVYFENHDRPRSINYYMPEGADKIKAAQALATILLTMRGTPFIYQGEEVGMCNADWKNIDEINDIQSHGQYDFALSEGFTPEQALKFVSFFTRDNARTPIKWNNSDAVLSWYKTLAKFRLENPELITGDYNEILRDSEEIFAYTRGNITVAVNFSVKEIDLPEELFAGKNIALSSEATPKQLTLAPLEARIYK